ncbi:hypothetical protein Mterra_00816 [Calidithermus terrae]|uniref:DUF559 domain-containing protein n=1 Tax=Calidithermus terrae TaxID=1408545 RepID=A0A399F096_9DEIN|nr:endonuclease domain-containing protein [Calidithermus terrae]RIH89235.1 hypothetical protein Mterra_00816 [Calidithermus terrae]
MSRRFLTYNPKLIERAKELRKNMTAAERKLWAYLRTLEPRWLRQRPIDQYVVDFYCAERKLVIEVDGHSHFTEDGQAYDAERTAVLEGLGLKILRFTNSEVLEEFEGVCEQVSKLVATSSWSQG